MDSGHAFWSFFKLPHGDKFISTFDATLSCMDDTLAPSSHGVHGVHGVSVKRQE